MNHTVLLADDSLTIQKVIKITLANQPYEIVDCPNEEELFQKLAQVQAKVVFLDFNLSEKYTGYELTTKIKSISPSTKVLLLLGTFDTVDDVAMEKCGASEKIVKPFDSNKFIAICKQLVDAAGAEEIRYPDVAEKPIRPVIPAMDEDQWRVSHTTEHKLPVAPEKVEQTALFQVNQLNKEISDWGFNVPGVISDKATDAGLHPDLLPPVIGEVKSLSEHKATRAEQFETKFPETGDLDYPTIEEMEKPVLSAEPEKEKPHSKLLPLDSLNLNQGNDFEIEHNISSEPETDIKSLEDQIKDEVEENLWQVDEFEDLKKEVSSKMDEMKNTFHPSRNAFDESLFKPLDEKEVSAWSESTNDLFGLTQSQVSSESAGQTLTVDMRAEMEGMVKKYIQEYMDQMFQKSVEKISWEVIPDLAENLIRQELGKIANKILKEQN